MKYKIQILVAVLSMCLVACVDIFDPKLNGKEPKIVFEGILSNQVGPYFFQLSYSAGYNSQESIFDKYVNAAKVWITDETAKRTDLIDLNKGQFRTPDNFRGEIGKTYQVHIELSDGIIYVSKPETMRFSAQIDKVYSEFELTTTPRPKYRGNFKIYLDTTDPATKGDFYRWRWVHYERANYCAAYVVNGESGISYKKCCGDCWNISTCLGCITLASDNLINGKTLPKQYIGQIPFDNITPYYMLVEQMSLSREAYNFWKSVDEQTKNSGGIFDKAPSEIKGNIANTKDSTDTILGYFQVSAINQKEVYIQRNNLGIVPFEFYLGGNYIYQPECEPCKESPYRTAKRPSNWKD